MDVLKEIKTIFGKGKASDLEKFYEKDKVSEFFSNLSDDTSLISKNIPLLIEICQTVAKRVKETSSNLQLYEAIIEIYTGIADAYLEIVSDCDEINENAEVWQTNVTLYKMTLQSKCPCLISLFSRARTSQDILWSELSLGVCVEFLELLLSVLPNMTVKYEDDLPDNRPDEDYDDLVTDTFCSVTSVLPEQLDQKVQNVLVKIGAYCTDKLLKTFKGGEVDDSNHYHRIFSFLVDSVASERGALCVSMMPVLEKMYGESGLDKSEYLLKYTGDCIKLAYEHLGDGIDDATIQRHIDMLIKNGLDNEYHPTPKMLVDMFSKHSAVIKKNIPRLSQNKDKMCDTVSSTIGDLMSTMAVADPKETLKETHAMLGKGNAKQIAEFSERTEIEAVLSSLSKEPAPLAENLKLLLEICKTVAGRVKETTSDLKLFEAMNHIVYELASAFLVLLEACDDISESSELWNVNTAIYILTLETKCPCLIKSFHWTRSEEYVMWAKKPAKEHVELLKKVASAVPNAVTRYEKKPPDNNPEEEFASLLYNTFSALTEVLPKKLDKDSLKFMYGITDVCVDRMLELATASKGNNSTTFANIYQLITGTFGTERGEMCAHLLPVLEKMYSESPVSKDEHVIYYTEYCFAAAFKVLGDKIDDATIQRHIDAFLKRGIEDDYQQTPEMLVNVYSKHTGVIHKNISAIVPHLPKMAGALAMKICDLIKEIAIHSPKVLTKEIIDALYPCLNSEFAQYFALEALSKAANEHANVIDPVPIMKYGEANPMYMHSVCTILTAVGSATADQSRAKLVMDWLLEQTSKGAMSAHKQSIMNAFKIIGMKHPEVLKQYKPQIEKMTSDVQFKDSANSILDFIEGRSLAIVTEQVDANTEQLGIVTNDLAETKDNVARIDETVQQHSEDIKDLNTEVTLQREELEVVKAELAEAMIDIERIDRKTVDTTPTWSHDVAKLLDPESNTDWRLLAKRLSYSNDDLKAWAAHHSPCMSMLVEWFATHNSSEATRAVYIVLKDMGRDDAATVVADAMKAAGELVPVDEPLDLKHPPSVFISYQWGVQEKAVILKEYLTNAGFSCWLDIGQMGGGDKLYEKIDNGIRAAKVILSLVTEKYAKSANCNKEVNLSVNLSKPMFPLLMEKMPWPPSGAMGPIFSEYLFVRFFQRENERKEGIYWPEAKIEELIMQIRQVIEPDEKLVSKEMDDWWLTKTGNRVVGAAEKKLDNTKNPDVFISYQWGKQKEVYAFYKKLKSLGFTCWLDIEQMGAGDSLYDKIDRGIRNCKVVLSCVTEKYSLSLNCRREISLTSSLSKPIVPLLLEKTTWPPAGPMSMPLAQLKYMDCSKEGSLADEGCFNEILRRMAEHGVSLGSDGKAKPTKGKEPEKPAKGKEPEKAAPPANSQTDAKAADKSNSPAAQPKPTQSEAPAPPAKPEPAPKATSKSCVLL